MRFVQIDCRCPHKLALIVCAKPCWSVALTKPQRSKMQQQDGCPIEDPLQQKPFAESKRDARAWTALHLVNALVDREYILRVSMCFTQCCSSRWCRPANRPDSRGAQHLLACPAAFAPARLPGSTPRWSPYPCHLRSCSGWMAPPADIPSLFAILELAATETFAQEQTLVMPSEE